MKKLTKKIPAHTNPKQNSARAALLAWYVAQHRKLPWRASPGKLGNPYHVFVSEAMLQQTQVATVIEYFLRFIATFPSVQDLAACDEQQVLRLWQGLGYYRRARHLHAAAKKIVAEHGGKIPESTEDLLKLPGVGRYTAGAVASIAFGIEAAILDGNVARVLARLHGLRESIDQKKTRDVLWKLAEQIVRGPQAGDLNQALMELGAMICLPGKPQCLLCPLREFCVAHEKNLTDEIPVRDARSIPQKVEHHIVAAKRNGQYFFRQRPAKGLWSNMWELPTAEHFSTSPDSEKIEQWFGDEAALRIKNVKRVGQFKHQTTHRTILFFLWQCEVTSGTCEKNAGKWLDLNDLEKFPLAKPQSRAVKMLCENL